MPLYGPSASFDGVLLKRSMTPTHHHSFTLIHSPMQERQKFRRFLLKVIRQAESVHAHLDQKKFKATISPSAEALSLLWCLHLVRITCPFGIYFWATGVLCIANNASCCMPQAIGCKSLTPRHPVHAAPQHRCCSRCPPVWDRPELRARRVASTCSVTKP